MMPVMTIRYYAPSLQMASVMQVVLPERDNLPLRSAHVLLGPEGSDSSWWLRHARLEVLASTYGVVFLMPAVLEGCGFDMAFGYRFGQSLCQDLFVELEHDLPSLALRPETTWVVGLGLSGLGALHAALTRPDRFCGAACLGAVPDIAAYRNGKASSSYLTPARLKCLWGQREDGAPSVPDTMDLLTKRAREGAPCASTSAVAQTNLKQKLSALPAAQEFLVMSRIWVWKPPFRNRKYTWKTF